MSECLSECVCINEGEGGIKGQERSAPVECHLHLHINKLKKARNVVDPTSVVMMVNTVSCTRSTSAA